jgi:hypothetical protein
MNQTNMKTSSSNKLFLSAAALAVGILGATLAQAQPAAGGWTNRYNGPANGADGATAVAVGRNGNVFVTGGSFGSGGDSDSDYATVAYSSAGAPLWTNRYTGPGITNYDLATAVAVDGSGNVFVTGNSYNNGFVGSDYATVAYSSGGVPLWTNRYNGPGNGEDQAFAVAVDTNGNVFVTGTSIDSGFGSYFGVYATIKYSGQGVPLWTNRYGNGGEVALAVAVDANGNVFVTGGSAHDYATIKYSGAGVSLWTNRYNGPANVDDRATAMVVDGDGNVVVTGYSAGNGGGYDYATIKYSGAGVPLWTNRYNGPANTEDNPEAVAVDGGGNVFVTGYSYGTNASGLNRDYATIAYSSAGLPLWTNRYDGPGNSSDSAVGVAVDGSGNVFVTGSSYGTGGNTDYATIAYSGAGVPLWTNRYNGPGNSSDSAVGVAVDGSGNVFVTGGSWSVSSSIDYATIRYSANARVPLLAIARTTANTLSVSWPSPSTGFALQQNTNGLAAGNWSDVLDTPADDGTNKTVILNPPAAGNRFYRLLKP